MGSYENARIFVVDDEHYICQTLESLIETWGMHAEVDENPLSALRRLNEVHQRRLLKSNRIDAME